MQKMLIKTAEMLEMGVERMRIFVSLSLSLLLCSFLGLAEAKAQDCLTLDEYYPEFVVGECRTERGPGGEEKAGCFEDYGPVPTQPSISAYHYVSGSYEAWRNFSGDREELYREDDYNYIPPWHSATFPLRLGDQWDPHPSRNWTREVTACNVQVIVPAGTFEGCVEVETREKASGDLQLVHYACPCVRGGKWIDYRSNPSGDTWELVSFDRPEICDSGIDDDCDGATDCGDPDCNGHPNCGHGASTIPVGNYTSSDLNKSRLTNYLAFYVLLPLAGLLLARGIFHRR
jgi:hypothetical protein